MLDRRTRSEDNLDRLRTSCPARRLDKMPPGQPAAFSLAQPRSVYRGGAVVIWVPMLGSSRVTDFADLSSRRLSLSEIISDCIGDAVRRGEMLRQFDRRSEFPGESARPCSATDGCEPRCNMSCTSGVCAEGDARQAQRPDRVSPA